MRFRALLIAGSLLLAYAAAAQTNVQPAATPAPVAPQHSNYDRGVYLPALDTDAACGKIMSFNFTRGENPRLKSVTTCTPLNRRTEKRADSPAPKPQPMLRYLAIEPEQK